MMDQDWRRSCSREKRPRPGRMGDKNESVGLDV